jgi:AsmA protein
MAGEVAIGPDEIGLPQIRLTLGSEGFDGAVMLRHDGARPSVRATLAGDTLDLSPFLKPIASLGDTRVFKAADLDLLRSVDFDLRLSASAVEFGTVRLGDVATSVLTGADRIEMSLNRATVSGGTAKGRASLAFASDGYDAKAQGSFTGIEISSLLLALGQPRTITGAAQGQATLEAVGDSPEGLLRSLSGRAGILIRAGEISGVSLGEGLRRADDRAAAAATAWRSGRTPFQQLQLSFNLAGGMAEIADGSLDSAALHASLQGQVSLANRHAVLRARTGPPLDSAREGPTFVLDISGPWDRLQLVQNIDGLVQPSVAAPAHEER